jgi:hypothetical protein
MWVWCGSTAGTAVAKMTSAFGTTRRTLSWPMPCGCVELWCRGFTLWPRLRTPGRCRFSVLCGSTFRRCCRLGRRRSQRATRVQQAACTWAVMPSTARAVRRSKTGCVCRRRCELLAKATSPSLHARARPQLPRTARFYPCVALRTPCGTAHAHRTTGRGRKHIRTSKCGMFSHNDVLGLLTW